ncbi:uncharacterized protein M437DRAFT_62094 [Aureobasidium melanogenum CBS 110374]|uniref:Uncharacterized protein n=1 Tax=Aureobasidium melanogenum (strain CBS 110374) TaxID=1043003 RepID=A0A074W815_AURM1|nr:uncharacterized protein M437DRAFT_62094 [Aureobasidium melanogenum CBS 110374]KEQ67714.1 hypothetical protein M437DRAFT_62094 [Aureobasidium melanogenum CBS 110374]
MPVLVAPCVAVPVKTAPLKDMTVAGSDTAAKGKQLVTTTKTTAAIKGTSSKTVTKTVSKAASSVAKVPSKPPSAPGTSASKAPPSKPSSSTPAKSSTSKTSKKSSSQAAATAEKTSATVVATKTVVSASTSCSKKSCASAAKASTTSSKSTPSQKAAKLKAVTAPTLPLPGMKYIYPKHHTCLHIILRTKVWETSPVPSNLVAKTFYVPCVMSIAELIEQLMGVEGDKCKGWALTEVQEKGDGAFVKGGCVEFGSEKAKRVLGDVGWNEKMGVERPPVWMVLHKV